MLLIATLGVIYVTGYVAFLKEGLDLLSNLEGSHYVGAVIIYAILNLLWPLGLLVSLIQKAAA